MNHVKELCNGNVTQGRTASRHYVGSWLKGHTPHKMLEQKMHGFHQHMTESKIPQVRKFKGSCDNTRAFCFIIL